MGKDEKEMWDWLCGDMDMWSDYAKKEEENVQMDDRSADDNVSSNYKFNIVNDRIRRFIAKCNNNGV